jgi:pyruvate dehydrogenase E2 component (dihydrolipoyllysine-residue acetyltransferase)
MAKEFKLPDLGEGIHEGEILSVRVAEGDSVNEGDIILEVETDKAAVEVPSPYTGVVEAIRVKPGDTVNVGDVVMTFRVGEEAAKPEEPAKERAEEKPPKEMPEKRPREEAEEKRPEEKPPKGKPSEEKAPEGPVPASPATRRLARELGVDLRHVKPSGPEGLVTAEDVRAAAEGKEKPVERREEKPEKKREEKPKEAKPLGVPAPQLPDFSKWGPVERVPLRSIRKATAKQMALAWSQIPHVSNHDVADMTKLDAFQKKHKAEIAAKGGKLTPTVFALKALATALKAFPRFNGSIDTDAGEIVLKHYYHIGIAVATEDGLIVPVIRDVDRKSVAELSVELKTLAEKTRARKVTLEELQGGTFSVTNVGHMGGGQFVPIINYPQVAILGMGAAGMKAVVAGNEKEGYRIEPRLMMPLVLCIDHRVLDGADAIPFMRMIVELLEDPEQLFMMMT